MVYFCSRCCKSFEHIYQLTNHLKNKVPCDYICTECGEYLMYYMAYKRHAESNNCSPVNYKDEEIQQKISVMKQKHALTKIDRSCHKTAVDASQPDNEKSENKSIKPESRALIMSKLSEIQKILEESQKLINEIDM